MHCRGWLPSGGRSGRGIGVRRSLQTRQLDPDLRLELGHSRCDGKTLAERAYDAWQKMFRDWQEENPKLAALLEQGIKNEIPHDLLQRVPEFPADAKIATRKAGSEVLQPLAQALPLLIGGSADLYGSTLNYIESDKDFNPENWSGRNIRFGIREHGMCAILNGIAYD